MKKMQNDQDLLIRLKALEEENARLRAASTREEVRVIVTEGEYKGHPTLTFEGSVRRFTLGLTKLRALQEAWPQVDSFLQRHHKSDANDDDWKI
jgi:hypothetical protein